MYLSRLLAPTLREMPADAELPGLQWLMRAGYVRRAGPGRLAALPLMRLLQRQLALGVESLLAAAGFQPVGIPAGVADHRAFVRQLMADECRSYRQLPVLLHHLGTRTDETIRPRHGWLRAREYEVLDLHWAMPDGDDLDPRDLPSGLQLAMQGLFSLAGIGAAIVRCEARDAGQPPAHAWVALADSPGADSTVVHCTACQGHALATHAVGHIPLPRQEAPRTQREVPTPGARTVADQVAQLGIPVSSVVKCIVGMAGTGAAGSTRYPVVVLLRGDLQVDWERVARHLQVAQVTAASEAEVTTHLGVRPGFIGPFHLPPGSTVLADDSVRLLRNFSTGAGRTDWHLVDCNWADLPQAPTWGTFRMAEAGQACPRCKEGRLSTATGFLLARMQGASPHEAEQAKLTYTAADTSRRPYWFGGGSVGLSRLVQVAAELLADADGLRWPAALAPFQVIIMPGSPRDSAQMAAATALYQQAGALGLRPLLDDRDDRLGSKFKDADMLGIPLRLVAGKALAEGRVEARWRGTRENLLLPTATAVADLAGILQAWQPGMPEIAQAEPPGGV